MELHQRFFGFVDLVTQLVVGGEAGEALHCLAGLGGAAKELDAREGDPEPERGAVGVSRGGSVVATGRVRRARCGPYSAGALAALIDRELHRGRGKRKVARTTVPLPRNNQTTPAFDAGADTSKGRTLGRAADDDGSTSTTGHLGGFALLIIIRRRGWY